MTYILPPFLNAAYRWWPTAGGGRPLRTSKFSRTINFMSLLTLLAAFLPPAVGLLEQVNLSEQVTSSDFGVSTGLISQGYWESSNGIL